MPDAPANTENHATCFVHDWPIFVNGFHKGDLYPPEAIDRMVANFNALSSPEHAIYRRDDGQPFLIARVKIGHDKKQRLAQSLGFLNVGQVVRLEVGEPVNGRLRVRLWLANVPATVGAAMNAGWVNEGSIDIDKRMPNPADSARTIEGPILTAVSCLGEEQAAVKGLNSPVAVFADGSEVPPMADPSEWLLAMFETLKDVQQDEPPELSGNAAERMSVAFSSEYEAQDSATDSAPLEQPTVTPEELIAAFQALPPDQQTAVKAQIGGATMADGPGATTVPPAKPAAPGAVMAVEPDGDEKAKAFAAACKKAFADDPETEKQFSAMFSEFSSLKKRMSDYEASKEADQKKGEEAMSAAFSAAFDAAYESHGKTKITPQQHKARKEHTLALLATKEFASEASRGDLIGGYAAQLKAMPVNPMIDPSQGRSTPAAGLTPLQQGVLDSEAFRRHAPGVRAAARAAQVA